MTTAFDAHPDPWFNLVPSPLAEFDEQIVIQRTIAVYRALCPEHFAAAMATALAHKPGRDSKESTVITPKLPSSKFRGLLPLLLKICEVEN